MVSWEEWAKQITDKVDKAYSEIITLKMRFESFLDDFRAFRKKVAPLLAEHYKGQIVDLLSKELKPRSLRWIQHRIDVYPYHLLLQLEHAGLIEHTKSGNHNMYAIKL